LINADWRVAVVWQCALEKAETLSHTVGMLEDWINSDSNYYEIPEKKDARMESTG
jgi:G:T-mismatch repair DNA endonuclease (very short patch repair protein)